MRDNDPDLLDKLAAFVADGESIDWEEVGKLPLDEKSRRLVRELRLVAGLADHHRSTIDDDNGDEDDDAPSAQSTQAIPVDGLHLSGPPHLDGAVGRWGHLLLVRKIGEGAFGEVFQARDVWLDHPVALKLLKPAIANPALQSRILHEARKLARVRHPNVVTVHGADRHDGRIGFWMDFVEGQTLAEWLGHGRLSPGEAAHIGQEVCRALTAVHHAKLIHRDVKAQNVMRAYDGGHIILMDFGAGEFVDDPAGVAQVEGTPLYLAPEIFRGELPSVQSDIYAVGVLLYHLVTGRYPVNGPSLDALATAHQRGERTPLRDARPDLPDAFVAVVEKALDPDASHRYISAGDMLRALTGDTGSSSLLAVAGETSAERTRSSFQTARQASLALLGAAAGAGLLGFGASRVFEVAFHIGPEFAAGPLTFFRVGTQALLPFVLYWIAGAAVLAVLASIGTLVRPRFGFLFSRWRLADSDPVGLAAIVFLVGAGCLAAITWWYAGFFATLEALRESPPSTAIDLSPLSFASRDAHKAHATYSAVLSFALGYAVIRWLPELERRAKEASTVRLLKWGTAALRWPPSLSSLCLDVCSGNAMTS